MWGQIEGLLGANGILSAQRYLRWVAERLPDDAVWRVPTVFWLSASDAVLSGVCAAGIALSVLLIVGFWERWALVGLWALYLSVCTVGQVFLSFQWDALLLEASVVALLVARGEWLSYARPNPTPWAQFVLRLLLVKLVFSSGWVKLASGDAQWAGLTAMQYHYETQPLPTWLGWWVHQLPPVWHRAEVVGVLVIQLLITPWVLTPWRRWAFLPLVGLQTLIALTGNYCFFNLLTVALCMLLVPDEDWRRIAGRFGMAGDEPPSEEGPAARRVKAVAAMVIGGLVAVPFASTVAPQWVPRKVADVHAALRPFRTFNSYGLFAVMTTERLEIEIEGSRDGQTWRPYRFFAKPGPLDRAPGFVAPAQPRLDWQLWFAALGTARRNPWLGALLERLLEGSPQVLDLLAHNPFGADPPRFVRAVRYRYRFTPWEERRQTGRWWRRTRTDTYFPQVSLSGRVIPTHDASVVVVAGPVGFGRSLGLGRSPADAARAGRRAAQEGGAGRDADCRRACQ